MVILEINNNITSATMTALGIEKASTKTKTAMKDALSNPQLLSEGYSSRYK